MMRGPVVGLAMSALAGRLPSRRAVAAAAKLRGCVVQRRWPFLRFPEAKALNLQFDDLLELQRCRSRAPVVMVIGAFDGGSNDPTAAFIRAERCRAILVEPQPGPFSRLEEAYRGQTNVTLINAAIDERSGTRELHIVRVDGRLPDWTEQLGSFDREHVLKHRADAPGLEERLAILPVSTLSFADLLASQRISELDVLQIDAEGMDAALLGWFPFATVRPALLHYEVAHMDAPTRARTRARLLAFGYRIAPIPSDHDDVAVLVR